MGSWSFSLLYYLKDYGKWGKMLCKDNDNTRCSSLSKEQTTGLDSFEFFYPNWAGMSSHDHNSSIKLIKWSIYLHCQTHLWCDFYSGKKYLLLVMTPKPPSLDLNLYIRPFMWVLMLVFMYPLKSEFFSHWVFQTRCLASCWILLSDINFLLVKKGPWHRLFFCPTPNYHLVY